MVPIKKDQLGQIRRRSRVERYRKVSSENGIHTRPSSASRRTRFLRKSLRLIASLRTIRRSYPFITKKEGDFPRVIASTACSVTSLSAMKTPRVKVDLPSIFPLKTRRSASGKAYFSHFDSTK